MPVSLRSRFWTHALTAVAAAWLFAMAPAATAQAPAKEAGPEEVCKACHAEAFNTFAASKHGMKADHRTPANAGGCLMCHGQGALDHAAKGGGKGVGGVINPGARTVSASTKNNICLTCHQGDSRRMHWQSSVHAGRDVAGLHADLD